MSDWPVTDVKHTCRDRNYDPYRKPCRGCASQMSINSVELAKRKRQKRKRPIEANQ